MMKGGRFLLLLLLLLSAVEHCERMTKRWAKSKRELEGNGIKQVKSR